MWCISPPVSANSVGLIDHHDRLNLYHSLPSCYLPTTCRTIILNRADEMADHKLLGFVRCYS
jgi:hypothetical protein